uniref:Uncharacterized protein n=1 Tax=Coturnix japonica TaxID=93934 RepID=A0A8C2T0F4_COTJA
MVRQGNWFAVPTACYHGHRLGNPSTVLLPFSNSTTKDLDRILIPTSVFLKSPQPLVWLSAAFWYMYISSGCSSCEMMRVHTDTSQCPIAYAKFRSEQPATFIFLFNRGGSKQLITRHSSIV